MYHINLIDRYTDFTDLEFTKNVIMCSDDEAVTTGTGAPGGGARVVRAP